MDSGFQIFANFLNDFNDKLSNNTMTFEEGLLLSEFFVKHQMMTKSINPTEKDWIRYGFIGYYLCNYFENVKIPSDIENNTAINTFANQFSEHEKKE